MDDRQLFWMNEAKWPRNFAGNVFLARGVQVVGRTWFGDEWTGKEPATSDERFDAWWTHGTLEGPIIESTARPHQRGKIRDLLARCEPPILVEIVSEGKWMPSTYRFPPGAWRRGCELGREIDRERAAAAARFKAVQNLIRDGLAEGALVSVLRDVSGGEFSAPVPRTHWNTEILLPRFRSCQMNPHDPFSVSFAGKDHKLIFLVRKGLDAFVASIANPSVAKPHAGGAPKFKEWFQGEIAASPTTRTMIKSEVVDRAVKEFRLSKRHAERLREEIIGGFPDEVQAAWRKSGPLS